MPCEQGVATVEIRERPAILRYSLLQEQHPDLISVRGAKARLMPPAAYVRVRLRQEREHRAHGGLVGLVHGDSVVDFDLGDLYTESGQTLQSSFSAVSKPNFASKY